MTAGLKITVSPFRPLAAPRTHPAPPSSRRPRTPRGRPSLVSRASAIKWPCTRGHCAVARIKAARRHSGQRTLFISEFPTFTVGRPRTIGSRPDRRPHVPHAVRSAPRSSRPRKQSYSRRSGIAGTTPGTRDDGVRPPDACRCGVGHLLACQTAWAFVAGREVFMTQAYRVRYSLTPSGQRHTGANVVSVDATADAVPVATVSLCSWPGSRR